MMDKRRFFLLGFILFLTMTGYGIVFPTLPFLANDLDLTSFQMGTLITGWATAQFITAPLWGKLADSIGRKKVLIYGLFGFGIAFMLLIVVNNYWQLLFARIIGASLSSGTYPAVFAIVSDSTDRHHRNVAIAKMGALSALGFLCGPALGGLLAQLGIYIPFIVAGSLALVTAPFAWKLLYEPNNTNVYMRKPDSYVLSFSILFKKGYRQLYAVSLGVSVAASSFFGLIGYFMIERFDSTSGYVSLAFSVEAGMAVLVQLFLLERFYQVWKEVSIKKAGLLIACLGYIIIAFSPNWIFVMFGCALIGFGQACVLPVVISLLSKREQFGQGVTMGVNESMDSLGRIIGPLIGGFTFSLHTVFPFLTSAGIVVLLFFLTSLQKSSEFESGKAL